MFHLSLLCTENGYSLPSQDESSEPGVIMTEACVSLYRILTLLCWRPCGCVWEIYREEAAELLCPSGAFFLQSSHHSAQTAGEISRESSYLRLLEFNMTVGLKAIYSRSMFSSKQ